MPNPVPDPQRGARQEPDTGEILTQIMGGRKTGIFFSAKNGRLAIRRALMQSRMAILTGDILLFFIITNGEVIVQENTTGRLLP